MIPYALLSAELHFKNRKEEQIRILDLSAAGFTFRLADSLCEEEIKGLEVIKLHFFDFDLQQDQDVILTDFFCVEDSEEAEISEDDNVLEEAAALYDFCTRYRVETSDGAFAQAASKLMKFYMDYIQLKTEEDDAAVSEVLTGYPAGKDLEFYSASPTEAWDFLSMRERWFLEKTGEGMQGDTEEQVSDTSWNRLRKVLTEKSISFALSLDTEEKWNRFLEEEPEVFQNWFYDHHGLAGHPLKETKADTIYIGNAFCSFLFPDKETLQKLLTKAEDGNLRVVVVIAPVQEDRRSEIWKLLKNLDAANRRKGGEDRKRMEVVVNDWGTLCVLSRDYSDTLRPVLGVLLAKRRKDVRIAYKKGAPDILTNLSENSMNAEFFPKWLQENLGDYGVSMETCGYLTEPVDGADLHFPFYQMNTAGFCTLAAYCKTGDRGRQAPMTECPGYCKTNVLFYPEHLKMIGRYNTLFGYDEEAMRSGEVLYRYVQKGIRRLVLEVL